MSTSQKQIAANRKNATKSTGPKSPEGKAVASRNAIKHGIHACDIIIKSPRLSEDPAEYEQMVDSLFEELNPEGCLQKHLVLKIANSLWRYRRVINAETARINRRLETAADRIESGYYDNFYDDDDDSPLDDETTARRDADILNSKSMPDESDRDTLQRYEMRLDRQLTRAYRLLFHLQLVHASKTLPASSSEHEKSQNEPICKPRFDCAQHDIRKSRSEKSDLSQNEPISDRPPSRTTDNVPPPIGSPFKNATDFNIRTEKMQNEPISNRPSSHATDNVP